MASDELEIFFLPFLAVGHMIPLVDMARLFAARGVKVTIITTTFNAIRFQTAIDHDIQFGHPIELHILKFPSEEVGLPEGIEHLGATKSPEMQRNLYRGMTMLQQPIEQLFHERHPDCIVSDMFYPWTIDVASQLGIPRLYFDPSSLFSSCVTDSVYRYTPYKNVNCDTEPFVLPNLPHHIKMAKSELPDHLKAPIGPAVELMKYISESARRSYGVLVNSFYELEPDYVEYCKKEIVNKVWHIGPVSLCNIDDPNTKASRGSNGSINVHACLSWLDSKKPNSVIYVCFGSMSHFSNAQLFEIGSGLEASGHPFIWVVRKEDNKPEKEEWLPDGFEKRMMESGKGMIIRSWAPQVLILEHPAIGGFVTHGGWNSLLESVTAGVPMVIWPLFAEQYCHEKFITEVLRIGVAVGVEASNSFREEKKVVVKREKIEKAVEKLMNGGGDAEGMRKRVKELSVMAKQAVEVGGSSYASFTDLIQELQQLKNEKKKSLKNECNLEG